MLELGSSICVRLNILLRMKFLFLDQEYVAAYLMAIVSFFIVLTVSIVCKID